MRLFPLLVLGACTPTQVTVLPTVGALSRADATRGCLVVNSATVEHNDAHTMRYPHTSYRLYASNGRFLRHVQNHCSMDDESAEAVMLPPGRYFVIADSERDGPVQVPVRIAAGLSTVINLDGR